MRVRTNEKRAAVEEQAACADPPADDAERIGGMAVLGARLRQISGASLDVGQRRQRRIPARDRVETTAPFVRLPPPGPLVVPPIWR
jgi:hypothetical protein